MLKKTITYVDYDGEERTEDFYFNLTEAELMEMEMSSSGGLSNLIEKIVAERDGRRIIEMFKEIILSAYGEKSLDGRRFIKNQELRDAFSQTDAYNKLFMELATDAKAASEFVEAIIPKKKTDKENHPALK